MILVAIAIGWGREIVTGSSGENQFGAGGLAWFLLVLAVVVLLAVIAGFITWHFTRFVIDDDELRIESGAIFKKSTKIPFERLQSVDIIQPLAARIVGLAELRLDVGNSSTKLRYLSRGKASRLRDYLLTRAHGQQASIRDLDQQAAASIFTDLGVGDRPLVQVTPQRLIVSFLLSTEWLVPAAITIIILVVTAGLAATPYALGGLVPLLIGMLTLVWRRVIGMFNFTLAESPRGLRVTRGLTNLTSQSVPIDRIQGVKTSQSLLWKPLGWYRVDVDILGYAQDDSDNNESNASSVLLPVATLDEVELAIGRALARFQSCCHRVAPLSETRALATVVRLLDAPLWLGRPHLDHRAGLADPRHATSCHMPRRSRCVLSRARCSGCSGWPTSMSTPPEGQ